MATRRPRATIDFECRSAVNLIAAGTWRYAIDPSTDVLCLAFRLPTWSEGRTGLWTPAGCDDDVIELIDWITSGGLLEAHNAFFERCIWQHILAPRFGFPRVDTGQLWCSAAKAAAHALPRGLDDALKALRLTIRKDHAGHTLMMRMSKPRKPRKAERAAWARVHGEAPMPRLWHEEPAQLERLYAYCRQDVLAEEALSEALDDLPADEQALYLLDQRINERGFQIDRAAVRRALVILAEETKRLNADLAVATEGYVTRATQRIQIKEWLAHEDILIPDTRKETVAALLETGDLPAAPARVLSILRSLGKSSTAKYVAMAAQMAPDGRVRGGLLYHGASTGRWTGSGVQPHNFPKGGIKDMEAHWRAILAEEPLQDALGALSEGLRGAITAGPGQTLYVADYAAIEARVVLWLAEDDEALDVFREGRDIYCEMAAEIYGYPCNKKDHPQERTLGKVAILGLGYQMGASKFVATAATYGIQLDDEMSEEVVTAYRRKFWRVKQMWWAQHEAALQALRVHRPSVCGRITWVYEEPFLYAVLPSGRKLAYAFPAIAARRTPWDAIQHSLTFMGVNPKTKQWQRQTSYGGLLVENLTQAVARDVMAEALVRCEASGTYRPVLSVHDEIVAEANEGAGDVREFEALMARAPEWACDLPVAAEGWSGARYRK